MEEMKKKILVIGAEVGYGVAQALLSEGFDVKSAETHEEEFPRTVVFTELSLGIYDMVIVAYWASFDLMLEMRKRFPRVRIIFLNSYHYEMDEEAKRHGIDAVVRVPFEHDELLNEVRRVLAT